MNMIAAALSHCAGWGPPRRVEGNPFRLVCRLSRAATAEEIDAAWLERPLPDELRQLWMASSESELFVDADYGQWGLKLLSPADSASRSASERQERPNDIAPGDIVVGEFLGDQDLLLVDGAGSVLIAAPLDDRRDWYRPASGLGAFLDRYVANSGAKYWEAGS